MFVALITNHLKNGFFIFRPGEGHEYGMTLSMVVVGLSGVGGAGRKTIVIRTGSAASGKERPRLPSAALVARCPRAPGSGRNVMVSVPSGRPQDVSATGPCGTP